MWFLKTDTGALHRSLPERNKGTPSMAERPLRGSVGARPEHLKGFLLMLAVGIIHAHWIPQLPTIGYWWAVLVMAVLPSFGGSTKKADD